MTHLQTHITTKSSKSCHSSTLRVFSVKMTHLQTSTLRVFAVKMTHLQTHITTKSSKTLPFFDVTGFFGKNDSFANSHYNKVIKILPFFDVTSFFGKNDSFANFDVTGFCSKNDSFANSHYN